VVLKYRKSLGMLGFEPQTVQPVASHYTYYAVLVPVAVAAYSTSYSKPFRNMWDGRSTL
jgi:hypothetical protein